MKESPSTPYREIRIPLLNGSWVTTFRCDSAEELQEALEVARLERETQARPAKRLRRDVYRRAGYRGRLGGEVDGPERFYWVERWREVGSRS